MQFVFKVHSCVPQLVPTTATLTDGTVAEVQVNALVVELVDDSMSHTWRLRCPDIAAAKEKFVQGAEVTVTLDV